MLPFDEEEIFDMSVMETQEMETQVISKLKTTTLESSSTVLTHQSGDPMDTSSVSIAQSQTQGTNQDPIPVQSSDSSSDSSESSQLTSDPPQDASPPSGPALSQTPHTQTVPTTITPVQQSQSQPASVQHLTPPHHEEDKDITELTASPVEAPRSPSQRDGSVSLGSQDSDIPTPTNGILLSRRILKCHFMQSDPQIRWHSEVEELFDTQLAQWILSTNTIAGFTGHFSVEDETKLKWIIQQRSDSKSNRDTKKAIRKCFLQWKDTSFHDIVNSFLEDSHANDESPQSIMVETIFRDDIRIPMMPDDIEPWPEYHDLVQSQEWVQKLEATLNHEQNSLVATLTDIYILCHQKQAWPANLPSIQQCLATRSVAHLNDLLRHLDSSLQVATGP